MALPAAIVFFQESPEVLLKRAYIGSPGRRSGVTQIAAGQVGVGDCIPRPVTSNN
jgi:hypothetical protein